MISCNYNFTMRDPNYINKDYKNNEYYYWNLVISTFYSIDVQHAAD